METGDSISSSDLAVLITRCDPWLVRCITYILEGIFDSAPVLVADAQTEVFQDRYEGLVAIFGTAEKRVKRGTVQQRQED
jgi:hypothetical protein